MIRDAIKAILAKHREAAKDQAQLAVEKELARKYRLAWATGVETLYKFKGYQGKQREHVDDMLINSRVYFPKPAEFNDPFDVAPTFTLGGNPDDPQFIQSLVDEQARFIEERRRRNGKVEIVRDFARVPASQLAQATQDETRAQLQSIARILCLTKERLHPLQWSHYADGHRGVCLHFDCRAGGSFGTAREVLYSKDRVPISIPMGNAEGNIFDTLVMIKADFWLYEHEFRVMGDDEGSVHGVKLNKGFLTFDSQLLEGITIGWKMPQESRDHLFQVLDDHRRNLPIWEVRECSDRFWMECHQIRP